MMIINKKKIYFFAGVVLMIMREYSDIKFNSTSAVFYLSKLGLKDIIRDARGPNIFTNNGKKKIY